MEDQKQTLSNIPKCGRRTYFFDIKQAKNASTYLRITESWLAKEGQTAKRNSFFLFKDDVAKFIEKVKSYESQLINVAAQNTKTDLKEKEA